MNNTNLNDELDAEYDLKKLRVRRVGTGRAKASSTGIILDSDVAQQFPDSESVNEALRFLIRITKTHQSELTHK